LSIRLINLLVDSYRKLIELRKKYTEEVLEELFPNIIFKEFVEHGRSGINTTKNEFQVEFGPSSLYDSIPECKPDLSQEFFHYTSFFSLSSILNEACIRMYNLYSLKDNTEFTATAESFGISAGIIEMYKKNTYILSMCSGMHLDQGEDLNMWRNFGDNGAGCAIGFRFKKAYESVDQFLAKINYSERDYSSFLSKNDTFERETGYSVDLKELIKLPACINKLGLYSTEKEIRLIDQDSSFVPNVYLPELIEKFGNDITPSGKIRTYKKLNLLSSSIGLDDYKVEISRIIVGRESNVSISDLERLVKVKYDYWRELKGVKLKVPKIEKSKLQGI